jgi:hypothetical protein
MNPRITQERPRPRDEDLLATIVSKLRETVIPDFALLTLAMSLLMIMARFARMAKALMTQLLGRNLIGSLRNGHGSARPPQALPSSE